MKRSKLYYILPFAVIVLSYLVSLYTLSPEASTLTKYDLSPSQARVLSLSVAIPIILIWSLGLFGFLRFRAYAEKIKKDRDGKAFMIIGRGLGIFVYGLPVQALVSSLLNHITRTNPGLIPSAVILLNYILLGVVLASFYYIHKGAMLLVKDVKRKKPTKSYRIWQFLFVVLSVKFVYFTLNNPARQTPVDGVAKAVYYLPDWLIVTTIIIPYIAVWYLGLQSVYYLHHYRSQVPGVLYKKALGYISNGLGAVILASILQRFLSSLTVFFNNQTLKLILMILYVFILIISVGYILIAIGANKLRKIEEV